MQLLRILLLPALFAVLAAPTCLQSVRQTERGTYLGTAANAGPQAVHDAVVTGRLLGASGEALTPRQVPLCPSVLLPGERGAFETEDFPMPTDIPPEAQPVHVDFLPFAVEASGSGPRRADGLLVKETSRAASARVMNLEVTNNSGATYRNLELCAVVFDGDAVSAVSSTELRGFDLRPGKTITAELAFSALGPGPARLYAFGESDAATPPCCPETGDSTWSSANNGQFSLLLPPGWVYEPAQGIDSFVGRYVGDGMELNFDYGLYGLGPRHEDDPAYAAHQETIGGFTAEVVVPKSGTGDASVFFPKVGTHRLGVDNLPIKLTMLGAGLTPAQQAIVLQIFRSIRFP